MTFKIAAAYVRFSLPDDATLNEEQVGEVRDLLIEEVRRLREVEDQEELQEFIRKYGALDLEVRLEIEGE